MPTLHANILTPNGFVTGEIAFTPEGRIAHITGRPSTGPS